MQKKSSLKSRYWLLIPYIRPHRRTIGLAFLCTLLFTVFWPILAWLVGRMAKYIGAGDVRSILIIPGEPTALAQALERLWRSPQQRQQLGLAARDFVLKHHTWDRVAAQILAIAQA